jgi:hypothetical protein
VLLQVRAQVVAGATPFECRAHLQQEM